MINRKTIYEIIKHSKDSVASQVYDWFMLTMIVVSIIPLAFRVDYLLFNIFDKIAVSVFIIDYILRWLTADYQLQKKNRWQSFILYPFSAFAIIDILSILPSFIICNRALKLFRITRLFKILRVFKFIRYSKHMVVLIRVMKKEKNILLTVGIIAVCYIFITALVMFNVEESTMFQDFFDALYWATTTLTTVGYGDIYPATDLGRIISMFSAIFGVAVIALPSGVITASYLDELRDIKKNKNNMTTRVQESFAQLIETKGYSPFLNTILEVIVANGIDPVAMFKFKEEKGIEDIARFKEFTIDVVLDYAELCLEDDILTPYEVSCIRGLQLLFRIDGEDYAALCKMGRVHDLLIGQLEKLYEDNRIDASEVLVKGELQSLFGLGYSDFNAIAQQCAKEALERGANIKDLDIFLPYDQE